VSRDEKLLKRFLTCTNITVDDCHKILTAHGYELKRKGGSHNTYHMKGAIPITIPTPKNSKYVKIAYVIQVIRYLKLEG
jgi:predicted RNA binding protein YcfA (HicA-like mRNA interferase family)